MNKAELIENISAKTQVTKLLVEEILNAAFETIQDEVAKGQEVKIVGFGVFSKITKKSCIRRNPKNGVRVEVPESIMPKFRPGKEFRDLLN